MKKLLLVTTILSLASFSFAANATLTLDNDNNQFELTLDSDSDIYGLQFDISYDPSQIKLSEEDINHMFLNGDLRSNMSVYRKIKEPGLARVIIFDLGGNVILNANDAENVWLAKSGFGGTEYLLSA